MRIERRAGATVVAILIMAGCDAPPVSESQLVGPELTPELNMVASATNFVAPLSGRQEVPSVSTKGTGLAKFQLGGGGTALEYKLIVANIDDVTQSHIHLGARGQNGPVVAFLFGFVAGGVDVNGVLAEGTITDANVIPRDGFDGTLAELVARMRSGGTYVNVHTVQNPAGEIRGEIGAAGPR